MRAENKGLIYGLIGVCGFALTLPMTRLLIDTLNPIFIGVGRCLIAGLVAALLLLITRQPLPARDLWPWLFGVSLGVGLGFPIASAFAMQTLAASHAGVVLAMLPLLTTAFGTLTTRERPSLGFWLVAVICTTLVMLYSLLNESTAGAQWQLGFADLVLLIAVISAAFGYAAGARVSSQIGGWQTICWALVICVPMIIYPCWFVLPVLVESNQPMAQLGIMTLEHTLSPGEWLSFFYLAFISQLIAFFPWYHGLALGGVARVSQLQLLQPFITIAASVVLLSEVIGAKTWWFALAVVALVAVGKRMPVARI